MDRVVSSSFVVIALFSYQFGFSLGWTGQIALDVPRDFPTPSAQLSPHAYDCHIYYYNTFPMTCGSLLAFNKATLRCDSLSNVANIDPVCGDIFVLEALEALYDGEDLGELEDLSDGEEGEEESEEVEFVDEGDNLKGTQRGGWHGNRFSVVAGGQIGGEESFVGEGEGGLGEITKLDDGGKRREEEFNGEIHDTGNGLVGSRRGGWHGNRLSFVAAGGNSFVAEDVGVKKLNDESFLRGNSQHQQEGEFVEGVDDQENIEMGSRRTGWHGNRFNIVAGGQIQGGQTFVAEDVGNAQQKKQEGEFVGGLDGVSFIAKDGGNSQQRKEGEFVGVVGNRRTGWHGNRLNFVAAGQNEGGQSFVAEDVGNSQQRQEGEFVGGEEDQEKNVMGNRRTGWHGNRLNFITGGQNRGGVSILAEDHSDMDKMKKLDDGRFDEKRKEGEFVREINAQEDDSTGSRRTGWHGNRLNFVLGGQNEEGNSLKEWNSGRIPARKQNDVVIKRKHSQKERGAMNKEGSIGSEISNIFVEIKRKQNKIKVFQEQGGWHQRRTPLAAGQQFPDTEQRDNSQIKQHKPNNFGQIDRMTQVNPRRPNNQIGQGGGKSTGIRRDIQGNFIGRNGIKIKELMGTRFGPSKEQDNGEILDGKEHETSGGWNIFNQLWKAKGNRY